MNPRCLKFIKNMDRRGNAHHGHGQDGHNGRHGHHGRQGHHGHQDHNGWVVLKNKLLLKEEHWKRRRNLGGRCKRQFDHSLFLDTVFTTIPHKHSEDMMQKKKKMWLVVILPDSETSKDTCLSMIVKVETCGQRTASKSWGSTDFQGSELEPASKCRYSIWGSSSSTHPLIHSKYCWLICTSTCQQIQWFF